MNASLDGRTLTAVSAVRLAAEGDELAFEELVDAWHADLLRVAYIVCREPDLAAEAAQATWIIAWQKLPSLREPERIRSWLLAIAANEARRLVRARRRRVVVELSISPQTSVVDPLLLADDFDLRNALARLSPDDRALLALRYVAGLSSTELATAARLSASGTRARLARLLTRLRAELRDG
jgi:RNA polymerase sigma factor (sigma-70 family)